MSYFKGLLCLFLLLSLQACGLETVLEAPQMPPRPLCNDVFGECVDVRSLFTWIKEIT
jgi:hypothetical protein